MGVLRWDSDAIFFWLSFVENIFVGWNNEAMIFWLSFFTIFSNDSSPADFFSGCFFFSKNYHRN